jgi:hypothetical protein
MLVKEDGEVADKGRRSFLRRKATPVNDYLCVIRMIAEGVERMGFVDQENQNPHPQKRRVLHP